MAGDTGDLPSEAVELMNARYLHLKQLLKEFGAALVQEEGHRWNAERFQWWSDRILRAFRAEAEAEGK